MRFHISKTIRNQFENKASLQYSQQRNGGCLLCKRKISYPCLLPEWGVFTQGIIIGAVGAVVLLAMLIVRRKMEGKPAVRLNGKAVGSVLLGVIGALVLGVGMCMVMIWSMMIPGILVGIVGIILLLCLIPLVKGLK